jgi:hypothetical protein
MARRNTPKEEMDAKAAHAAKLRAGGLGWDVIAARLGTTRAYAVDLVARHNRTRAASSTAPDGRSKGVENE